MDLYAYSQIDKLSELVKENGIEVPRTRGYRLMSEEKPVSPTQIEEILEYAYGHIYEYACVSRPRFRPNSFIREYSDATDRMKSKYLITEEVRETFEDGREEVYEKIVGFRWDLIHGKNKKALKLAIKNVRKNVLNQMETFNKYVCRNDVLFIHARIGGDNWSYFKGYELESKPWFLEKVDDWFDDTYCDIYAVLEKGEKND